MKSLRPRPDLTTIQGHKYQTKCDLATATIESDFGFLISDGLLIRREGLTMQPERFPKIYALCKSSSDKDAFIHSQGITTFVSCNPVHWQLIFYIYDNRRLLAEWPDPHGVYFSAISWQLKLPKIETQIEIVLGPRGRSWSLGPEAIYCSSWLTCLALQMVSVSGICISPSPSAVYRQSVAPATSFTVCSECRSIGSLLLAFLPLSTVHNWNYNSICCRGHTLLFNY